MTAVNSHYRSGPPTKLFALARVKRKERTKAFQAVQMEAEKRKASSAVAVATKTARLLAEIRSVPVPALPALDEEELTQMAKQNYNSLHNGRSAHGGDEAFIARITVNYVRHCLTDYEATLCQIAGRTGSGEARLLVAELVFDAIADAYPWLGCECGRQYSNRLFADT